MRTRIWLSAAALVIGAFTASVLAGAGGGAPLVDAVKAKDKAAVLTMLQKKVNVNTPEEYAALLNPQIR